MAGFFIPNIVKQGLIDGLNSYRSHAFARQPS